MNAVGRNALRVAAVALLATVSLSRPAAAQDDSLVNLGLLLGGSYYDVGSPADEPGDYTFLFGSSFSGAGFMGGPTLNLEFLPLFTVEADLLFSTSSVSGFAEVDGARRDVDIQQHALRLGVLAKLRLGVGIVDIDLGVGPELAISLDASVNEVLTGVETTAVEAPIEVDTPVYLYPVFQLGVAINVGPIEIPLALRFGLNPAYPSKTNERFGSFQSPEEPGPLTVGTDWYLAGLIGVRFGL